MQALPQTTPARSTRPATRRSLLALALPSVLSLAAAVLLVASPPAHAQNGAAEGAAQLADPELAAALASFAKAGPDHHAAIEDAAERLGRLSAAQPADAVLRAYAGAAVAMRALTTSLPWRKMSHAEDGLALIDKALAQLGPADEAPRLRGVPAVLEARFVAASTFLGLPPMFNRAERGRAQLDAVLGHALFDAAPAPFKAVVWLRAARLAEADAKPELRRQWLQKVADSGAPQATAAREQLKAL
jgi:hypothetical protein